MARNALGRFTRHAGPRRSGRGRLGFASNPVTGTEVSGVVTGEPIVLGGSGTTETAAQQPARETTRAKS